MLRALGADAVGMSTVPEVITARGLGIRCVAVSCLTNYAAGVLDEPLNHEEVLETTKLAQADFQRLVAERFEAPRREVPVADMRAARRFVGGILLVPLALACAAPAPERAPGEVPEWTLRRSLVIGSPDHPVYAFLVGRLSAACWPMKAACTSSCPKRARSAPSRVTGSSSVISALAGGRVLVRRWMAVKSRVPLRCTRDSPAR